MGSYGPWSRFEAAEREGRKRAELQEQAAPTFEEHDIWTVQSIDVVERHDDGRAFWVEARDVYGRRLQFTAETIRVLHRALEGGK